MSCRYVKCSHVTRHSPAWICIYLTRYRRSSLVVVMKRSRSSQRETMKSDAETATSRRHGLAHEIQVQRRRWVGYSAQTLSRRHVVNRLSFTGADVESVESIVMTRIDWLIGTLQAVECSAITAVIATFSSNRSHSFNLAAKQSATAVTSVRLLHQNVWTFYTTSWSNSYEASQWGGGRGLNAVR